MQCPARCDSINVRAARTTSRTTSAPAGLVSSATAGLSLAITHVLPRLAVRFTINPPFGRPT